MIMSPLSKVEMSGFTFFAIMYGKGGKGNAKRNYRNE